MELLNATRMQAAYTMGTEPSAREHLVVAVKGTFTIPEDGGPATACVARRSNRASAKP